MLVHVSHVGLLCLLWFGIISSVVPHCVFLMPIFPSWRYDSSAIWVHGCVLWVRGSNRDSTFVAVKTPSRCFDDMCWRSQIKNQEDPWGREKFGSDHHHPAGRDRNHLWARVSRPPLLVALYTVCFTHQGGGTMTQTAGFQRILCNLCIRFPFTLEYSGLYFSLLLLCLGPHTTANLSLMFH